MSLMPGTRRTHREGYLSSPEQCSPVAQYAARFWHCCRTWGHAPPCTRAGLRPAVPSAATRWAHLLPPGSKPPAAHLLFLQSNRTPQLPPQTWQVGPPEVQSGPLGPGNHADVPGSASSCNRVNSVTPLHAAICSLLLTYNITVFSTTCVVCTVTQLSLSMHDALNQTIAMMHALQISFC